MRNGRLEGNMMEYTFEQFLLELAKVSKYVLKTAVNMSVNHLVLENTTVEFNLTWESGPRPFIDTGVNCVDFVNGLSIMGAYLSSQETVFSLTNVFLEEGLKVSFAVDSINNGVVELGTFSVTGINGDDITVFEQSGVTRWTVIV